MTENMQDNTQGYIDEHKVTLINMTNHNAKHML